MVPVQFARDATVELEGSNIIACHNAIAIARHEPNRFEIDNTYKETCVARDTTIAD